MRVVSFPDGMNKTLNRIIEFLHFLKLTCLSWPRKTSDSGGWGGFGSKGEILTEFPIELPFCTHHSKTPRLPQKNRTQSVRQTFPLGNFLAFPIDTSHANCTKPTKKKKTKRNRARIGVGRWKSGRATQREQLKQTFGASGRGLIGLSIISRCGKKFLARR